ncbi:MAG: PPOX class F420-dependent oxidoreductase [Ktedonobacterales bacterium]
MIAELSEEARRFLAHPNFAVLATINADGTPQQTVLWYEIQGEGVMMNTAAGRLKDRNLRRDPRASLCVTADGQGVTLRGRIELIDDQATAQADIHRLAVRYDGPEAADRQSRDQFGKEHRVTLRLKVEGVVLQGFDEQ